MKKLITKLICGTMTCLLILVFSSHSFGQRSVGIGTESPNPNALLDLVTTGDQGLLLPRMTTAQRTAPTLTGILTASDNGLTVFDTDEGLLYFWFNGSWITSTASLASGAGINIVGNVIINDGDIDATDDVLVTTEASGDVSGTFSTTVVEGIQGNPVSTTLPSTGQVLKWNGSAWEPAADDGQVLTQGTGIDLTGNVITNIGDIDPSDDVLITDTPAAGSISGSYDAGFSINDDAIGTSQLADAAVTDAKISSLSLGKLQQGSAADGNFLVWNEVSGAWEPSAFDNSIESQGLTDVLTVNSDGGALSISNLTDLTLTGGTVTVATEATHQAAIQSLTGVAVGSADLGLLSHPVLMDNQTILGALIQLGDSIDSFGSATFSTAGELPVGDGLGLTGSGIYSSAGNLGIGTTNPVTSLQISDRSHFFQFQGGSGENFVIIGNNFYSSSPTTFERTNDGTGSFIVLSDSSGFEVQRVSGGPAGAIALGTDNYAIFDVDSAEFRVDGLLDASNGFFLFQGETDHFFALNDNNTGSGYNFEIQGSNGTTQGGDITLTPGGFTSTGVNGSVVSNGELFVANRSGFGGQLTLEGQAGSEVTLSGPSSSGTSYNISLPEFPGSDGDFLTYFGSGQLDWSNPIFVNADEIPRGDGTDQVSSNIFSDGSDVGIGVVTPSERLDVDGNIEIPSNREYRYAAPKSKTVAISPLDFKILKLSSSSAEINFGNSGLSARIINGDANDVMGVPINLPDGAIITDVTIWGTNNSSTEAVDVELISKSPSTAFSSAPIVTIPTLTSGVTSFSANPGVTINYSAGFSYFIKVTGSGSGEIGINGIRITYTVSKVD